MERLPMPIIGGIGADEALTVWWPTGLHEWRDDRPSFPRGPKRFEAVIGRRLKEAGSVVAMALSIALPIGHSILRTL
jgi:hypothetical protein